MAAAIGTTAPDTRGNTFFDVWEWGGRPGDMYSGSVDKALEDIRNHILHGRDAAVAGARSSPAIIYFRDSTQTWYLKRPFFVERPFWEIRGGGREQTKVAGLSLAPCFIFGMPRGPQDPTFAGYDGTNPVLLNASQWVDCHGVLDASAAPAAGQKWGLRLKNVSMVSCPLTPFSHGISDGWASTRQMTVDFCVDPGAGLQFGYDALFGMGDARPMPWHFQALGSNEVRFSFAVTGANQPASQFAQFSLGAATGPMKITFQIDLVAAKVQAWVNGVQVPVSLSDQATFTAANNMSFVRNDYAPFNIGKRDLVVIFQESTATVDHTYHGLQISNRPIYKDSMGNPQARLDNTLITDANRYFDTGHCVACLALTDPPPGHPECYNDGRVVTILGSGTPTTHGIPVTTAGYFLNVTNSITPVLGLSNRISDITVSNGGCLPSGQFGTPPGGFMMAFGQAIAIGAVWEMMIDNVAASSFGQGIGSLNGGAVWTHYLSDVVCEGGDAGYYNYWTGFDVSKIKVTAQGRAGVRFVASTGIVRNLFLGDSAAGTDAPITINGGQYGGIYEFEAVNYDNEFGGGPLSAMLMCEATYNAPATLRITNLFSAKVLDDGVLIWLKDMNPGGNDFSRADVGYGPHTFTLDGLVSYGFNHAANIRTDGTLWNGTVENFQVGYGGYRYSEAVPMFDNTGPGGQGRVVCRQRDYVMPPRSGKWDAHCHVLDMQLPAPGSYATLRCVGSGTYGTPTPPIWSGLDVLDSGIESLGGYLVDHVYWATVALS